MELPYTVSLWREKGKEGTVLSKRLPSLDTSSLELCRYLVLGHPLAQGAERLSLTLQEYLLHTYVLFLQVDLQRKVEERNRLLAEYKVMEFLFTGGFAGGGIWWFFSFVGVTAISLALGHL